MTCEIVDNHGVDCQQSDLPAETKIGNTDRSDLTELSGMGHEVSLSLDTHVTADSIGDGRCSRWCVLCSCHLFGAFDIMELLVECSRY